MKKILFLLIISIGFGSTAFSTKYEKPKENYKIHNIQPKKNENKAKPGSISQMPNSNLIKQNKLNPTWDCWAFSIPDCCSGWVCAETIQEANYQVVLILINYCINGGGYGNCQG